MVDERYNTQKPSLESFQDLSFSRERKKGFHELNMCGNSLREVRV